MYKFIVLFMESWENNGPSLEEVFNMSIPRIYALIDAKNILKKEREKLKK